MSNDPLVGKVLADRFEILARVGEGGTGVVYKAKQLSVDRIVAIKLLGAHVSTDPQWVKRFHNEARAASKLTHPNTVQLIDFGQTKEGLLFIAMEFLSGTPLSGEIEAKTKLPYNRALSIVAQMCASLSEAHQNGIIHRDIKPDNVFLVDRQGAGDHVKVLDFSVAKMDSPDAQVTRAGIVFGTPSYMSPEQGRGAPLDRRSDVYAVGIVLYEMLTGKPPFDSRIPTEVVLMHLQKQPAPMQGIHPRVAAITMKALAKEPAHRQQSAEELEQECMACLNELGGRLTPGAGVPLIPQSAQPEMQTMMANEVPKFNPPVPSLPPQPHAAPPAGGSEMRTMMAQAPILPQQGAAPQGGAEMRTMMGTAAPILPPPSAPGAGTSEQRTMMAQAPVLPPPAKPVAPQPAPQQPKSSSTVVLGQQSPALPAPRPLPQPPPPKQGGGALFYMTFMFLGVGLGLALHFLVL